jgi:hypothetical protein
MEMLLLVLFGPALLYLAAALLWGLLDAVVRLGLSLRRRPRRPLPERNRRRAGMGGFLVALALGLWAHGVPEPLEPISAYLLPIIGGFGVVLLVGGIHGANGASFDFLDVLFWIAVAIGCAALLVFEGHLV